MGTMSAILDACPNCGYALVQPPPPQVDTGAVVAVHPLPSPGPRARHGIAAASVPKLLLGLGAVCLLVAAVIFLAVAWSWLGVGGRTAVLVGLTAAAALTGQWLARRGLVVGAEALTTVALGLVVLDLLGTRRAGWLGTPTDAAFVALVGGAVLVVSLALSAGRPGLVVPQLTAPLGLALLVLGVGIPTGHRQVTATVAVLLLTAGVAVGRAARLRVLPWSAGIGAGLAFLTLALLALDESLTHPSLHGLWAEGHGAGLVAVAALALLPWALFPAHDGVRQWTCAVTAAVLTWAAATPVLDEGRTAVTLAAAAGTAGWALLAAATPPRWYAVPRLPLAGTALALLPVPLELADRAVVHLLSVADPFTADASVPLDPGPPLASPLLLPLGVGVLALAAALTLPRSRRWALLSVVPLAITALLTAASYPLPLWLFVVVLGPLGIVVSWPSAVLTLVPLGEIVVVAAALVVRRHGASRIAGAVLPIALAGFAWTAGHVLDVPLEARSLVTLTVLGLLAVAVPRLELELAAATAAGLGALAGIGDAGDPTTSLAIHLTVAGALVTSSSLLHRSRRSVAWLGGLLLAAATWVRLHDLGVVAPEAYTLPTATALVLVGLHRLRRDVDADTRTALLPGLALALVPSLLWALADPLSLRAALLGLGCLMLMVGGGALRWSAPVVAGWLVGAVLVLRELQPYAAQWPQWALIGVAGSVLIGVGLSWEARVRDLHRAATYLARLR